MLRAKRGGFIYRGDLYIRAWELQSESRQRTHQHQRNLCISVSSFDDAMALYIDASYADLARRSTICLSARNGPCPLIGLDNRKSYHRRDIIRDSVFSTVFLADWED